MRAAIRAGAVMPPALHAHNKQRFSRDYHCTRKRILWCALAACFTASAFASAAAALLPATPASFLDLAAAHSSVQDSAIQPQQQRALLQASAPGNSAATPNNSGQPSGGTVTAPAVPNGGGGGGGGGNGGGGTGSGSAPQAAAPNTPAAPNGGAVPVPSPVPLSSPPVILCASAAVPFCPNRQESSRFER